MTINYTLQTFDNQEPPHRIKTIKIRNASSLPTMGHIVNVDLEDFVVKEVRHRIGYKSETFTSEDGIQSNYQEVDDIVVIAMQKDNKATYSLK
ncbi:hypothetical protein [Thiomicrorhabdus sediminis]|uniref:Uncharacterized protein n=1 Tax=Thiomicrorhabdus sediminis TaxID=2580412 RepID=A0A4P9K376_9GAMM|nr:hypothetical protein [Thiomicrorhabdus sediminis]QCU89299.1 hypothetical protein FE785_00965 [Thiomicrorhabdus sediminis]